MIQWITTLCRVSVTVLKPQNKRNGCNTDSNSGLVLLLSMSASRHIYAPPAASAVSLWRNASFLFSLKSCHFSFDQLPWWLCITFPHYVSSSEMKNIIVYSSTRKTHVCFIFYGNCYGDYRNDRIITIENKGKYWLFHINTQQRETKRALVPSRTKRSQKVDSSWGMFSLFTHRHQNTT